MANSANPFDGCRHFGPDGHSFERPDQDDFVQAIANAPFVDISAGTLIEAHFVALGKGGAQLDAALSLLIGKIAVTVAPVDNDQVEYARIAIATYGRGRHKAHLNLGDSFAYALAMQRDEPLLFKGDDFAQTDVKQALQR